MSVFNRYIFKNLMIATLFVAIVMSIIILLTQSLKFLELVINSGASGASFWMLTVLALPRFFEIILPFSLMAGVLFLYSRMIQDSELVVARGGGYSNFMLAQPAIFLALLVTAILYFTTMWGAPKALSHLHEMRQIIKAQVSSLLFREGTFNRAGSGVMVYVRDRPSTKELRGVLIYDARETGKPPAIILAKRGVADISKDGYRVTVFNGARQQFDRDKNILQRLRFSQYTVDFASSEETAMRWREPEERTLYQLLHPNMQAVDDRAKLRDFKIEIHRRLLLPLLAPLYVLIACAALLHGQINRQSGQGRRVLFAVISVLLIQSLFLSFFSFAQKSDIGLVLLYASVILPYIVGVTSYTRFGQQIYRRLCVKQVEVIS
jgi:lipopolysaccharide export system permease protein